MQLETTGPGLCRPRMVVFDAVGTLIQPVPSVAEAYAQAAADFGCVVPPTEVGHRFRAAFARQEDIDSSVHAQATSELRERARWCSIVHDVFPEVQNRDALFECLWLHFADGRHWRLHDDVLPAWERLQSAGVRIAIGSNFDERLPGLCGSMPALSAAEQVFVSSQLGWRKPHVEFFRAIERALGLAGSQIVLVGDDFENDYQGALNAGWRAVLVDREGRRPEMPHVVRTLSELSGVLVI